MQTANSVANQYTTQTGQKFAINGPSGSASIDNGVPGASAALGYVVNDPKTGAPAPDGEGTYWDLPSTQNPQVTAASYVFGDSPDISVPAGTNNLSELTVGTLGGNPPFPGGDPETFTTYLMYKPDNGIWVGLASVDWGWGGDATSNNGTTLDPDTLMRSDSGSARVTQPLTGNAAFPTWTVSTQTVFGNGWQQVQ